MAVMVSLVSVAVSILYTPVLLLILCVIFLASIGKSLGVRRLYVNILLKLFEYGRQHIEVAKKLQRNDSSDEEETPTPDDKPPSAIIKENGTNGTKMSVIERQEILGPSPELNYKRSKSQERLSNGHKPELKPENDLEFHLHHCMDLVRAGAEAIIEDQVTSVFEAEELRSWNLLTRTNRQYEFLTWRLTIIWAMGFVVRYFFLLPLRILIFLIGVIATVPNMWIIGILPRSRFRDVLGVMAYKILWRTLLRSVSCVTNFHDLEYMPRSNGFCVANHTSPIDVAVMGVTTCFSLVWWLIACTAVVGSLPDGAFKHRVNDTLSLVVFNFLSRCISSVVTYHDRGLRPQSGICVANHTSPIDVLVLMCDRCYSLIGQRHNGFLGLLQRALARASPHIWFERSEVKDRHAVARRLKEHISVPDNPPILIFPEGTCINNTSVMQFKKGSFEVGGTIYPVAIKYDPRFGDAFWNSSRYGMLHYLLNMMSSWAIVCDVWYLPAMTRRADESAVDFANRVKSVIARRGGLVDLMWDGQLKRMKAKKEWRELQQEEFSKRLKGEIGQRHNGFLGLLQRALARASPHIWFERSEVKDRHAVARRLKEHISVPDNPPILIFPEGTCINNTSVMQFKKGSFEVGGTIYPVAIKYDPRFGDAFWNSSRYGMLHYLLNMMSSWAIVCDVWYLPAMTRRADESAVDFANRVKSVIARRGGLVDLMWDGQLKRMKAKKEWRELQQEEFSKRLKGE